MTLVSLKASFRKKDVSFFILTSIKSVFLFIFANASAQQQKPYNI